ncbi:MAG: undecaprenyl-diphosphate phosphatase [Kiritimatiellae bacterium]|jgi:undecaprenyl-diphosphatase|nr:undecaprenyl-diphosphate phosphatase [Kiritimatiellia bacterium]
MDLSFVKVIILAAIQGVAEFLPISSSGHLVIAKNVLHLDSPGVLLELILHAGTLLSIFVFYHKKILSLIKEIISGEGEGRKYVLWVLVSMIPAFLAFIFLEEKIESFFDNPGAVGIMLCVTGLVLISQLLAPKGKSVLTIPKSLLIGIAQSFAMLPGISRSGSTITMARHLKIEPAKAAEFSFLMSIPLLLAATLLGAKDLIGGEATGDVSLVAMLVGFFVSAVVGLFAIKLLVKILCANKFWYFGIYCIFAGLAVIVLTA